MNILAVGGLRVAIALISELLDAGGDGLYCSGVKRAIKRKKLQFCSENQITKVLRGVENTLSELGEMTYLMTEDSDGFIVRTIKPANGTAEIISEERCSPNHPLFAKNARLIFISS